MIPKMSSAELNDIMLQSKDEIKSVSDKIDSIKLEMEKKLLITEYDNQYTNLRIQEIKNNIIQPTPGFRSFTKDCTGAYDSYGYSSHPKFLRNPLNMFNIELSNGQIFFRDDVKVMINSVNDDSYKSMLMHDSLAAKDIFFKEFDTDTLEISISADATNPLGPTLFNTIELDSYLPGSYDIVDITYSYYDVNGNKNTDMSLKDALYSYRDSAAQDILMKEVGQTRLILPDKVSLIDITFKLKLNYSFDKQGKKVYPFGLKHLYFYEADYNVSSTVKTGGIAYGSYIITTITSNQYINMVYDEIALRSTIGNIDTRLTAEKIELYLDYVDGVLDTPINPGDEIPRNTNTIYVRIPLVKLESIIGIQFNIENR